MVTGSSFILLKRGRERERRRGKKRKRRKRKREKATRKPDFTPKVAQLPFQPPLSVAALQAGGATSLSPPCRPGGQSSSEFFSTLTGLQSS